MHVVTLRDPSSSVAAQFVPDAGMIGTSLTDAGVERCKSLRHRMAADAEAAQVLKDREEAAQETEAP